MSKLKELIETLANLIKPTQPINEMSRAFAYKDRLIEVCAWVEGPMRADNRYFKYYNNMHYSVATKVARIRIDEARYVGGNHKEGNKKKWVLTPSEKQELVDILNGPSEEVPGYTRWQDILITFNRDNFNLSTQRTLAGDLDDSQRNPHMPKHIKPFPIDYPMPNYMEIKE